MTRLEQVIEQQEAIARSQREFMRQISNILTEAKLKRDSETEANNHKQNLNILGGCPYGEG